MSAAALQLTGLCVELHRRSGPVALVEDVSLAVAPGAIMGIVGETGAGKTVTTKALMGLLPTTMGATGTVTIGEGAPIDVGRPEVLQGVRGREIGLVQQNPMTTFDPLLRLRAQLLEGVLRRRLLSETEATERAHGLLTQMGFADPDAVLDLYPHQLSGGMSQRLAIAMALMPRPRVIIADEPTSALDAHLRLEVLELLRTLGREEGAGILLVSHDLGLVSHHCDALTVMYAGRVVEQGPTSRVLGDPRHPYTRALLACSPALDAPPRTPLYAIPGTPPLPTAWPAGCVFAPRCPRAVARCVAERPALRAVAAGPRVAACHFADGERA